LEIKIDNDNMIIEKTETGEMFTERSLSWVKELAFAVQLNPGYNVLMDLRETTVKPEMLDLMQIASACRKLRSNFDSKIAFLIPNTEERVRFSQLFKSCMEAQDFRFRHFFDREAALEWLTK